MLLDFCLAVVVIVVVFGAMCWIGDDHVIVEIVDHEPVDDPRDLCAVKTCRRRWTHAHPGYGLCDEHEAARKVARSLPTN